MGVRAWVADKWAGFVGYVRSVPPHIWLGLGIALVTLIFIYLAWRKSNASGGTTDTGLPGTTTVSAGGDSGSGTSGISSATIPATVPQSIFSVPDLSQFFAQGPVIQTVKTPGATVPQPQGITQVLASAVAPFNDNTMTVYTPPAPFIPSSAAPYTDNRPPNPVNYTSVPSSAAPYTDNRPPVNVSAPPISATVGVMPSNPAPITDNRPAPKPVTVAHPLIIRQPVVSTPLKPTGRGTNIAF